MKQVENSLKEQLMFYGNLLDFSKEFIQKSEEFLNFLLEYNQKVNLISRRDEGNVVQNHWIHSMAVLKVTDWSGANRVLDLGTGGGLPGILLALYYPEIEFVLVDSIRKKTNFIEQVIKYMEIRNVQVVTDRVENIVPEYRLSFDIITARAVAPLVDLWKWSHPLLKENGKLIAWKGHLNEELPTFKETYSDYREIEIASPTLELDVPKLLNMHFVVIQK